VDEITLTPLELIARIAALMPPLRTHRYRNFGVLAPNSPLRGSGDCHGDTDTDTDANRHGEVRASCGAAGQMRLIAFICCSKLAVGAWPWH
jgi:hypothetical protein